MANFVASAIAGVSEILTFYSLGETSPLVTCQHATWDLPWQRQSTKTSKSWILFLIITNLVQCLTPWATSPGCIRPILPIETVAFSCRLHGAFGCKRIGIRHEINGFTQFRTSGSSANNHLQYGFIPSSFTHSPSSFTRLHRSLAFIFTHLHPSLAFFLHSPSSFTPMSSYTKITYHSINHIGGNIINNYHHHYHINISVDLLILKIIAFYCCKGGLAFWRTFLRWVHKLSPGRVTDSCF